MVSVCSVLIACGGAENRKADYMEQALESFENGDYEKAKLGYKNAIQIDPKDPLPRIGLAKSLVATRDWRAAAAQYQGALNADPANEEASIELGKLFLLARATDQAQEQVDKVFSSNPDSIGALTLSAAVEAQKGNTTKALNILETLSPEGLATHDATVLYVSVLSDLGKLDQAMNHLNTALKSTSKPNDLLALRARLHHQQGQTDKALGDYERLVEINPESFIYKQRLVQFMVANNQSESAIEKLRSYAAGSDNTESARKALVDLLVREKRLDEASQTLKTYIAESPDSHEFKLGLGRLTLARGELEQAKSIFSEVIEADPRGPSAADAQLELAKIDLSNKALLEARKRLDLILSEHPSHRSALMLRGRLSLSEQRFVDAINDFRSVLSSDPDDAEVTKALAQSHYAAKELDLAANYFKQLERRFPDDLDVKNSLASVYKDQGKHALAIKVREDMQLLAPNNGLNQTELANLYTVTRNFEALNSVAEIMQGQASTKTAGMYYQGIAKQGEALHREAVALFDAALQETPNAIEPISAKIKSLVALERTKDAIDWLDSLANQNINASLARNFKGELLLVKSEYDRAIEEFRLVIADAPRWDAPRRNLALAYKAKQDLSGAIKALEEAVNVVEQPARLRVDLAQLYEASKDSDKAIEQYDLMYQETGSQFAANNLAMLLVTYDNSTEALDRAVDVAQALRGSNNPFYMDTLAWVYFKRSEIELAMPLMKEAARIAPEVPQINYHLALAYQAQNDPEQTIAYLEKALDKGVSFVGKQAAENLLQKLKAES